MNVEGIFEDRRFFPRLYLSLYFEYTAQLWGSDQTISDWAVLKDISLSGVHFRSESAPSLKPGDIAIFTFKFHQSDLNPLLINEIQAKGLVKRIEASDDEAPHFSIAVEFLSGPIFRPAD